MAGKLSAMCHQINPLTWLHDRIPSACSEVRWPFPTPFETAPNANEDNRLIDTCILPARRIQNHITGVVLDYEVSDGRSPQETKQFLTDFAQLVKGYGKEVGILLNPLNAPSQRNTGVDPSNANYIHRIYDFMPVFLWSRNREGSALQSYRNQMSILRAGGPVDPRKLVLMIEIGKFPEAEIAELRRIASAQKYRGIWLWRNYADLRSSCSTTGNVHIQCLAFGRCSR